jgi:hypothetical protein
MDNDNNNTKNFFRLEGCVHRISELDSGISRMGNKWHRLDLLVAVSLDRYTNYYPIILWNDRAISVHSRVSEGDNVAVEGLVNSKDYKDYKDGSTKYFINLSAYRVSILDKNISSYVADEVAVVDTNDDDAVPF